MASIEPPREERGCPGLAGYCADGEELDSAIARYALDYADRTCADHEALVAAVKSGRLPAERE